MTNSLKFHFQLANFYNAGIISILTTNEGGVSMMKATGIVRKIDELGRVVIPVELRKTLHIQERDSIEFFVDGDMIVLTKYEPACTFTGSSDDLIDFHGRKVSRGAVRAMAELAGLTRDRN